MYRLIKWSIYIWTAFCLLGLVTGIIAMSETPAPTSDAERAGAAIGTALGVGFWAVLWFIPTVGLGLIALLVRPRGEQSQGSGPGPATLCAACGKYYAGQQNFCPHCGKPTKAT